MLDDIIKTAIRDAVSKNNQNVELAEKIISWMDKISEGEENINDRESYMRRCKLCYDTTILLNNIEENGN